MSILNPADRTRLDKYTIEINSLGKGFTCTLIHEDFIDPAAIATVAPTRNFVSVYVNECGRKHGEENDKLFNFRKISKAVMRELEDMAVAMLDPQVILITGCSAKKQEGIHAAGELYLSTRITFAKRIAEEKDVPLHILSAKYGLVNSETLIDSYDELMDETKAEALLNEVVSHIRLTRTTHIVFFAAGVNVHYRDLMKKACKEAGIGLSMLGTGCMGGAKELPGLIDYAVAQHSKGENHA